MYRNLVAASSNCHSVSSVDGDGVPRFHEICEGEIWMGPGEVAVVWAETKLRPLGVTHIVNVTQHLSCEYPHLFQYCHLPVDDSERTDIGPVLEIACEFIQRALRDGGKVYVHCHAGISRSSAVVIAFLMKQRKMHLTEAFAFVHTRRPVIAPNDGFLRQLHSLEVELFGPERADDLLDVLAIHLSRKLPRFTVESARSALRRARGRLMEAAFFLIQSGACAPGDDGPVVEVATASCSFAPSSVNNQDDKDESYVGVCEELQPGCEVPHADDDGEEDDEVEHDPLEQLEDVPEDDEDDEDDEEQVGSIVPADSLAASG